MKIFLFKVLLSKFAFHNNWPFTFHSLQFLVIFVLYQQLQSISNSIHPPCNFQLNESYKSITSHSHFQNSTTIQTKMQAELPNSIKNEASFSFFLQKFKQRFTSSNNRSPHHHSFTPLKKTFSKFTPSKTLQPNHYESPSHIKLRPHLQ